MYHTAFRGLSHHMETLLELDTSTFPAHYRHTDDHTVCEIPKTCSRDTFIRSGVAGESHWRHMDDDSFCDTPEACSLKGRSSYFRGGVTR